MIYCISNLSEELGLFWRCLDKLEQEYVRRWKVSQLEENRERNVYLRTSVQCMFKCGTVRPLNMMVLVITAADFSLCFPEESWNGVIVRTEPGKVRIPGQRY